MSPVLNGHKITLYVSHLITRALGDPHLGTTSCITAMGIISYAYEKKNLMNPWDEDVYLPT